MEEILDGEDIVVLRSEDGKENKFINIARIALSHGYYAIMQPTELPKGMEEDEAFVFSVGENNMYTLIVDDTIVDEVFAEYGRLIDEAEEQI